MRFFEVWLQSACLIFSTEFVFSTVPDLCITAVGALPWILVVLNVCCPLLRTRGLPRSSVVFAFDETKHPSLVSICSARLPQ